MSLDSVVTPLKLESGKYVLILSAEQLNDISLACVRLEKDRLRKRLAHKNKKYNEEGKITKDRVTFPTPVIGEPKVYVEGSF